MSWLTSFREAALLASKAFLAAFGGKDVGGDRSDAALNSAANAAENYLKSSHGMDYLDPRGVSVAIGVSMTEAIAGLAVLEKRGLGRYRVLVRDSDGDPIQTFDSFPAVPSAVTDDWGNKIITGQHNTELVFEPSK